MLLSLVLSRCGRLSLGGEGRQCLLFSRSPHAHKARSPRFENIAGNIRNHRHSARDTRTGTVARTKYEYPMQRPMSSPDISRGCLAETSIPSDSYRLFVALFNARRFELVRRSTREGEGRQAWRPRITRNRLCRCSLFCRGLFLRHRYIGIL